MTVTLTRPLSRPDFDAAVSLAKGECECDEVAKLIAVEVDSVLCRPCRARKRCNELVKVIDEG